MSSLLARSVIVSCVLVLSASPGSHARELPSGIVDYLRAQGEASSFRARIPLFKSLVSPTEKYKGTAEQNIRLRNALVARDHAPAVSRGEFFVDRGAPVILELARNMAVTAESELAGQSRDSRGGRVDVGRALPGVFPLRLIAEHGAFQGTIVIAPSAGRLRVSVIGNREALPSAALLAAQLATASGKGTESEWFATLKNVPAASEFFVRVVTVDDWKQAAKAAGSKYLRGGGAVDTSTTFAVCAVGGTLTAAQATAPLGGLFLRECGKRAAGQALDYGTLLVEEVIAHLESRSRISASNAKSLRAVVSSLKLVRLGADVWNAKKGTREKIEAALSAASATVELLPDDTWYRLTLVNLIAEGKKIVVISGAGK